MTKAEKQQKSTAPHFFYREKEQMSNYEFTEDWVTRFGPLWVQTVPHLPSRKKFLEIGSYEGHSAAWTLENMVEDGGVLYCIDDWSGGGDLTGSRMVGVEEKFRKNIAVALEKNPTKNIIFCHGKSRHVLPVLLANINHDDLFDFIYIDGSHTSADVMLDACYSLQLLKKDGLMVFDDYLWKPKNFHPNLRPKIAVDAFVNIFDEEVDVTHSGFQLFCKKK